MPTSQNRSNFAFRHGFLRLVTGSNAQSGFKVGIFFTDDGFVTVKKKMSMTPMKAIIHNGIAYKERHMNVKEPWGTLGKMMWK